MSVNAVFEKRLAVVWLILAGLTLASLLVLAVDGGETIEPNAFVAVIAVVVSLFKVRLILQEFMEVRHAPKLLGRLTDSWLLLTGAILIGTYLVGLSGYHP